MKNKNTAFLILKYIRDNETQVNNVNVIEIFDSILNIGWSDFQEIIQSLYDKGYITDIMQDKAKFIKAKERQDLEGQSISFRSAQKGLDQLKYHEEELKEKILTDSILETNRMQRVSVYISAIIGIISTLFIIISTLKNCCN